MATSSRASPGLDTSRPHSRDRDIPDRRSISRTRANIKHPAEPPRGLSKMSDMPEESKRIRALLSDVGPSRDQNENRPTLSASDRKKTNQPHSSTQEARVWRESHQGGVNQLMRGTVLGEKNAPPQPSTPLGSSSIPPNARRAQSVDVRRYFGRYAPPSKSSTDTQSPIRPPPIPERSSLSCRSVSRLRGGAYPSTGVGVNPPSIDFGERGRAMDSGDLRLAYRRSASRRAERPTAATSLKPIPEASRAAPPSTPTSTSAPTPTSRLSTRTTPTTPTTPITRTTSRTTPATTTRTPTTPTTSRTTPATTTRTTTAPATSRTNPTTTTRSSTSGSSSSKAVTGITTPKPRTPTKPWGANSPPPSAAKSPSSSARKLALSNGPL